MKVSVVLATFNGDKWIGEQLASIAEQTLTPDELIVSDDASQDDTLEMVRRFAASAPFPVTVLDNADNVGFARNFERALAKCSGDLVFLADQDDVWLPQKIATVAKEMQSGAPLALHNAICVDAANVAHDPDLFGRLRLLKLTPDWAVKGCCTAITGAVVAAALPVPDGKPHDTWLHAVARAIGEPVFIDAPLIRYRLHPEHTSVTRLNQLEPTVLPWYAPVKYRVGKIVRRPSSSKLRDRLAEVGQLTVIARSAGNGDAVLRLQREEAALRARLDRRDALRRFHIPVP